MSLPQTDPSASKKFAPLRPPLVRVSRKSPCPACRRPDWCLVASDGSGALCMRRPSERPARRGGGWWHSYAATPITTPPQYRARPRATAARVDADHVHYVLRSLLREHLSLSPQHRAALLARGLSAEEIERHGYASEPTRLRSAEIAAALSSLGLDGVPGFYFDRGAWRLATFGSGFYVPVRDERRRISGLQLRRDAGRPRYLWFSSAGKPRGTSSGAPTHFARPDLMKVSDELIITEGALKADVIACLSRAAVVGLPGVNSFGHDFACRLRDSFPRLRRAVVAYDRDFLDKPPVYRALERLVEQLRRAFFHVSVRTWQYPAKGYDDFLLSQLNSKGDAA